MEDNRNKYLAEEYNQEAKALYYKGDNAGAVRFLVKALSVDPLNEVAISALAFYCLRPKEEAVKANITFETIKTTAEAMHGMVSQYRKTRTLSSRTFSTCAMLYKRIRNRRMCFYYYSLAWRAEPDDPAYPVEMADILLSEQSYGEAVMLCYRALEIDPTYAYAYYIKGMIEIKVKRFAWAVDALETFVALSPVDNSLVIKMKNMLAEIRETEGKSREKIPEQKPVAVVQTELLDLGLVTKSHTEQLSLFE
jgi:tetratricopeptide (TPR) repeat protein